MFILEDLWSGNEVPYERQVKHGKQYAQICQTLSTEEDELLKTFTPEQRQLYDELGKHQMFFSAFIDCETFIHAFKLGAKIMLDVLSDGEMREV
jgi:hypothetical protein